MENRKRLIELLKAVRYTTNDIEKVADEICLLFSVSQQRELLIDCVNFCDGLDLIENSTVEEQVDSYLLLINCG